MRLQFELQKKQKFRSKKKRSNDVLKGKDIMKSKCYIFKEKERTNEV